MEGLYVYIDEELTNRWLEETVAMIIEVFSYLILCESIEGKRGSVGVAGSCKTLVEYMI